MRITILQGAFLPVPTLLGGAVEKLWFELGKDFAALGHEVVQVSRKYAELPKEEIIDGVAHIRIPGFDTPSSLPVLKLYDLLYTLRAIPSLPTADIIVTNTFWAPLVARKKHGLIYVDVQRMPKGQMRLYNRAARFRANSSAVKSAIIEEFPNAEPKTAVIPNPLPFNTEETNLHARKERRILYTGRIHKEKGLEVLLAAFSALIAKEAWSDWTLDIVGPHMVSQGGGGEQYLDSLKSRWNDQRIVWHGPIFDVEKLNQFYKQASLFIYPSLAERGETFGLAPLEAMAWGCIPVVSNLDCFKDFIKHRINGYIFDHRSKNAHTNLASAITTARANDFEEMSKAATEVRESHSTRKIAHTFLSDFDLLLSAND